MERFVVKLMGWGRGLIELMEPTGYGPGMYAVVC